MVPSFMFQVPGQINDDDDEDDEPLWNDGIMGHLSLALSPKGGEGNKKSQQMVIKDGFDGFAMGLAQHSVADAQKHPLVIEKPGEPTAGIQF